MTERDSYELDAASLRALAHPLRIRILGELRASGPATATQLAERFEQRSGTTSWHLRQLAEHGFVEQDTERGNRRERWWRAMHSETALRPESFSADAELGPTLSTLLHEVAANHHRELTRFLATLPEWSGEWVEASELSDWVLSLSHTELAEFTAEAGRLVERYRRAPAPGDETVLVQLRAFPRGERRE
ncbi:Helix-turn-helix domain-containing protein [Actinopolyspora xinjiangensis]|uniref:Helix-turn-helix domain-containing protein n=1 Tax=Actinopolyspora xinjiangensis TaxID=405564 RepID=A0A1H0WK60_9ACTN|nr:helix-turn-helix domain-containing protein [Actinopolyspora xinjiangensis]SDP90676.1 Helix-turn-helix domain-containing protein [Actinopolyspora xinjiangensis]